MIHKELHNHILSPETVSSEKKMAATSLPHFTEHGQDKKESLCDAFTTACRVSSVGIETRYGLEGAVIESRWGRDFPHLSRPALGPTQPAVQWVPGHFPGVNRPGRGADHPPDLVPRLKKE
jgi:hypothetical protein